MKLASAAVLFATLCTPVLAHADTSAPQDSSSYRSEDTAVALSLGGTAASVGLVALGLTTDNDSLFTVGLISSLFTPSLGHWYAGDGLTAGMGLRAVGAASVIVGVGEAFSCWGEDSSCDNSSAGALLGLGLTSYAVGTIYDIATAGSAAREHNEGLHVSTVAPTAIPSGNGQVTMGMGVGGTF